MSVTAVQLAWLRAQMDLGTSELVWDRPFEPDFGQSAAPARPAPVAPVARPASPVPPRPTAAPVRPSSPPPPARPEMRPPPAHRPPAPPPAPAAAPVRSEPAPLQAAPRAAQVPVFADLEELGRHAASCQRCILGEQRKQAIWMGGAPRSSWLVVTPFAWNEDLATGQLLSGAYAQPFLELARSIGLPPPTVAALLACPPANPADQSVQGRIEAVRCRGHWTQILRLSQARAVMVLDQKAAHLVRGIPAQWPAFRGQRFEIESLPGIPMVATHHPARLQRDARLAPQVESDLRQILSFTEGAA